MEDFITIRGSQTSCVLVSSIQAKLSYIAVDTYLLVSIVLSRGSQIVSVKDPKETFSVFPWPRHLKKIKIKIKSFKQTKKKHKKKHIETRSAIISTFKKYW